MRERGPDVGRRRSDPSAGRSRGEVGCLQPSTDRLGAGPGDLRPILGEHHADQFRPPSRVFATQGEDRLANLVGMGMIGRRGGAITGKKSVIAQLASPFQEMPHGAWREIERLSERGHGFPLSGSLPDFLTDGNGNRFGH
jgi:hypothetical protein